MCWSCVANGYLSSETESKIDAFNLKWDRAQFGPSHLVTSDSNVDNHNLDYCICLTRAALDHSVEGLDPEQAEFIVDIDYYSDGHSREELTETLVFLEALRRIPEHDR